MAVLSTTWKHMRRSPYQALTAISIITLTFIVVGLNIFIAFSSIKAIEEFEKKPQVIAFFEDIKDEEEILDLKDRFENMGEIASVKYVSKEEALSIYKEEFREDPLLLEMVSADILPASLEISAVRIDYLSQVADILNQEEGVEDIVYPKDAIDIILSRTQGIKRIGLILLTLSGVSAFLTIITIISLKVVVRRKEIEILQLVGATRGYVRAPFLLEGMLYGVIGSLTGVAVNIGLAFYDAQTLNTLTGFALFPVPIDHYVIFALITIAIGVLLGLFASVIAVNRFLS